MFRIRTPVVGSPLRCPPVCAAREEVMGGEVKFPLIICSQRRRGRAKAEQMARVSYWPCSR